MVKVEGKAVVTIDGQEAGKQLETLQSKATELRKRILEIQKEKIIDNDKIKLISKNLNEAETNVSQLKLKLAELHTAEILDKKKIAETNAELKLAKQKVTEFKNELEIASKSKSLDILNSELKQTEKQINQVKTSTFTYQQVLKNLDGSSLKELQKAHKLLTAEVEKLDRNTEQYILKTRQLKTIGTTINSVKSEMKGVNEVAGKTPGLISKISDGFNKYSGIALGVIASLTGVVLGFRQVVTVFNDFEEKEDNLSALTGLAGEQLEWLSDEARYLATSVTDAGVKITQGAGDIVDAFTTMGSKRSDLLGVKEDLASVTEDAILLSQAAKMELDPAVNTLAITMNQFQSAAKDSRKIVNELAAGSKIGAADVEYLGTAMEKAGTRANLMKMSTAQTTAAIETFAPYWASAETAGNSFDKVLLKLQTGQIGYTNGIFNLQDALEELETRFANGETSASILGDEHSKMGEILVANKDTLATYTEQITGTNIAVEQAIINTNNNASALAQAKNRVEENSIVLGEKLAPALTFSTNAFSYLMKVIIAIIENWDTFKKYLITGIAAVVSYTIAIEGVTIAKKAYSLAVSLAEKAQKLFNSTVKSNPVGLLIAALVTVVTAVIAFRDRLKESNKTIREFNKELQTEKTELNNVFDALKKTNPGTKERKELIAKINEEYGEYLPNQLDENANLLEIAEAQTTANNALQRNIVLKYQTLAQEEAYSSALETRIKYSNDLLDNLKNTNLSSQISKDWDEIVNQAVEAEFRIEDVFSEFDPLKTFVEKYKGDLSYIFPENDLKVYLDKIVKAETSKNDELLKINSVFNSYLTEDTTEYYNQELMDLKKQLLNKLITEEEYLIQKAELQAKYGIDYFPEATTDTTITDEEDYETDTDLEDAKKLAEEKAKAKKDAETELAKYIREMQKELLENEKQKALAEIDIWKDTEEEKIKAMEDAGAASEDIQEAKVLMTQAYVNKLSEIEDEYYTKKTDAVADVYEFLSEKENILATERQKIIDAEIESIENEYQERINLLLEFSGTEVEIALLEKARAEEIAAYKIEKEQELAEEILAIREEYGLITDEEYYQTELDLLDEHLENKYLTQEEYEIALANLEQERIDKQKQARIDEINAFADSIEQKKAIIEAYGNVFDSAKNLELQITEKYYNQDVENFKGTEEEKTKITERFEAQKKEIEKKYAGISLTMSIAKAVANGAVAITRALAELGPIAGTIAAIGIGTETGIQIIAAQQQYEAVSQLSKGKYPVIGKDDGKLYNADYVQRIETGIVSRPTLVAEEPEAVIDYKTLYNPSTDKYGMTVLDHFNSIRAIKFNRVHQLAEGKYPDTKTTAQLTEIDYSAILVAILSEMKELKSNIKIQNQKMDTWQKNLKVDYYSFETAVNEVEKLKTDTSISR